MATKRLFKATVTTTVYFVTGTTDKGALAEEAEKFLLKDLRANGLRELPEPVLVDGRERCADGWEQGDYVHGSEKMAGGKQSTLIELMEEAENKKSARLLTSVMGL
jgi:hypothetical protein